MEMVSGQYPSWCSKCLLTLLLLLIISVDWSVGRPSVKDNSVNEEGSEVTNDDAVLYSTQNQRQEDQLDQDKLIEFNEQLRQKLLEQLGFHEANPISKYTKEANISKTEYLRAYTEYMGNVRERRQRERTLESTFHKVRRSQADIFVQRYSPETQDKMDNGVSLRFPLAIELDQSKYRLQVRKASLFLPQGCSVLTDENETTMNETSVVTLDLTREVSRWMTQLGGRPLEVSVPCSVENLSQLSSLRIIWMKTRIGGGRARRSLDQQGGGGPNRRHHLSDFVGTDGDETGSRGMRGGKKRGGDCGQMKHGKSCCRKSLTVSFEDLKITDVILAPIRFDMDYCEGRCNAKRLPYASNHAMFQHIINRSKNTDLQAPKLCCTPTKLSELDVIQMDPESSNQLKVTVIHNAKVEECGCS